MAHNNNSSRARQAVKQLEKPEGISACKWRGVVALLMAIADHYPKAYPSQERLAAIVGCDVRSIQRYQAAAVAHGLLLVKADAGKKGRNNTWSKTNRYLILNTTNCRHSLTTESRTNPTGTSYPPGQELRSFHSPSESSLSAAALRFDPEGQSRQVVEEPKPSLAKKPPRRRKPGEIVRELDSGRKLQSSVPSHAPRPPKSQAWRRCATRFLGEWDEMVVNTPAGHHLRSVRPAESIGHFKNYLNAHFFGPEALTPKDEAAVEQLITDFMSQAARGRIKFKSGQSAWMAFTGTWGRENKRGYHSTPAVDDYVPPQHRGKS
jgi:hypothetical protein